MSRKKSILLLSWLLIVSLTACHKDKTTTDDFGQYESTEEVKESNKFAVEEDIEVQNETEPIAYYDRYADIDRSNFTSDEIEELEEIDNNIYVDKFTGEAINLSDL